MEEIEKQLLDLRKRIEKLDVVPKRKTAEIRGLKDRIERMSSFEEKLNNLEKKISMIIEDEVSLRSEKLKDSLGKRLENFVSDRLRSFEEALNYSREELMTLRNALDKIARENEEREIELLRGIKKRFQRLESKIIADLSGKFNAAVNNINKSFKEIEGLRKELWDIMRGIEEHKDYETRKIDEMDKKIAGNSEKFEEIESNIKILNNFSDAMNKNFLSFNERLENMKTALFEIDKKSDTTFKNSRDNTERVIGLNEKVDELVKKNIDFEKHLERISGELGEIGKREAEFKLDVEDKFSKMSLLKDEILDKVKEVNIEQVKKEIETLREKFGEINDLRENLEKVKAEREVFFARTKKLLSITREIEFDVRNELSNFKNYEDKIVDLMQIIEKHEERISKEEKENLINRNKISEIDGRIFALEKDKTNIEEKIAEISRKFDDKESIKRVEEIKQKLELLEKETANKKELDELKEYIEVFERKNSEILEMLLEKFGV